MKNHVAVARPKTARAAAQLAAVAPYLKAHHKIGISREDHEAERLERERVILEVARTGRPSLQIALRHQEVGGAA